MNCDSSELHAPVLVSLCVLQKVALDWHPRPSEHSSPAPGFSQVESGGVLVS